MSEVIAKILVTGDDHYCSKQYGAHKNYPAECLYYSNRITALIEERKCTHWVGLGDFSYGRFLALEFREKIEEMFKKRQELLGDNMWYIKGNHDTATYGMTEYEYYLSRKEFKGSEDLVIGGLKLHMRDYGDHKRKLDIDNDKVNVLLTHGYFKFEDSMLPDYGTAVAVDDFDAWYGVDYVLSGHIHQEHVIKGSIAKDNMRHECFIHYLPCLSRPAYMRAGMADTGHVVLLNVYDDGDVKYESIDIPLLDIEKSFNLAVIEAKDRKEELTHIDVADIAKKLSNHDMNYGNTEDIIMSRTDIDEKYRLKAVELLKNAMK